MKRMYEVDVVEHLPRSVRVWAGTAAEAKKLAIEPANWSDEDEFGAPVRIVARAVREAEIPF